MDKQRILIVDDEDDVLSVLEKGLTGKGYLVATASNGKDAIMLARSKQPDLILLDILMPDMDGTEVAGKLREDPKTKDIPVMFLTCLYTKGEERENGSTIGNNLMVAKPYDMEELLVGIEKII